MGAAEAELGQHRVWFRREFAVGEEQQLDQGDERLLVTPFRVVRPCAPDRQRRQLPGSVRIYVSHVD
jgi:hypothetical protein